jgi:hypothetical protein
MDWRSTNSLDWFKGKSTGNPWFLPSNIGLSCKFSHHPILWLIYWFNANIMGNWMGIQWEYVVGFTLW